MTNRANTYKHTVNVNLYSNVIPDSPPTVISKKHKVLPVVLVIGLRLAMIVTLRDTFTTHACTHTQRQDQMRNDLVRNGIDNSKK